jgi:broad specificity phosphatase PhoE
MPRGADGHEFFARFDDSIAAVASVTTGTVVVVTHGAAMRVWAAARAINIAPSSARDHEIHNTGVLEFEGSPREGWTLVLWQNNPVGGIQLDDPTADDHIGETLSEARGGSTR